MRSLSSSNTNGPWLYFVKHTFDLCTFLLAMVLSSGRLRIQAWPTSTPIIFLRRITRPRDRNTCLITLPAFPQPVCDVCLCSGLHFLLMSTLGGRGQWLQDLGPCHPPGRGRLSTGPKAVCVVSASVSMWGVNQQAESAVCMSLAFKQKEIIHF